MPLLLLRTGRPCRYDMEHSLAAALHRENTRMPEVAAKRSRRPRRVPPPGTEYKHEGRVGRYLQPALLTASNLR